MRVTSFASGVGALIFGIIIADILIHPEGTQAASNGIATIAKPSYNALLGQPS